jgi:hypothetical protein
MFLVLEVYWTANHCLGNSYLNHSTLGLTGSLSLYSLPSRNLTINTHHSWTSASHCSVASWLSSLTKSYMIWTLSLPQVSGQHQESLIRTNIGCDLHIFCLLIILSSLHNKALEKWLRLSFLPFCIIGLKREMQGKAKKRLCLNVGRYNTIVMQVWHTHDNYTKQIILLGTLMQEKLHHKGQL